MFVLSILKSLRIPAFWLGKPFEFLIILKISKFSPVPNLNILYCSLNSLLYFIPGGIEKVFPLSFQQVSLCENPSYTTNSLIFSKFLSLSEHLNLWAFLPLSSSASGQTQLPLSCGFTSQCFTYLLQDAPQSCSWYKKIIMSAFGHWWRTIPWKKLNSFSQPLDINLYLIRKVLVHWGREKGIET